jgi:hypothetical protein
MGVRAGKVEKTAAILAHGGGGPMAGTEQNYAAIPLCAAHSRGRISQRQRNPPAE